MKKIQIERGYKRRFQISYHARDGRILRPHIYKLHELVPSSWGRVRHDGTGADRFMWFQLGRFMFTTM
jgi:hypothetical protein